MSKFYIPDKILYVCAGSKCYKKGGKELCKNLKAYTKHRFNKFDVEIIKIECTDRCKLAPILTIQPDNIWITECTEKKVIETLESL